MRPVRGGVRNCRGSLVPAPPTSLRAVSASTKRVVATELGDLPHNRPGVVPVAWGQR